MLFGDANDFAIEATVEPELEAPSAVWGRMCIHIGDMTLGDFDDHYCALYPAYGHFEWHAKRTDKLWDDIFTGMLPEQIHDTVRHAIYGDDDRTLEEIRRDSRRFADFDFLTNGGEQFEGYASVIASPSSDTIMVIHRPHVRPDSPRRLPGDFVIANCSRSGFIRASELFVQWFHQQTKRLTPKEA